MAVIEHKQEWNTFLLLPFYLPFFKIEYIATSLRKVLWFIFKPPKGIKSMCREFVWLLPLCIYYFSGIRWIDTRRLFVWTSLMPLGICQNSVPQHRAQPMVVHPYWALHYSTCQNTAPPIHYSILCKRVFYSCDNYIFVRYHFYYFW